MCRTRYSREDLNGQRASIYRRFVSKTTRQDKLLEVERRFMELDKDEAEFAATQEKRADFMSMRYTEVNDPPPVRRPPSRPPVRP
jgi:hypothetical protein